MYSVTIELIFFQVPLKLSPVLSFLLMSSIVANLLPLHSFLQRNGFFCSRVATLDLTVKKYVAF